MKIKVSVPATSANIGSGFDALGTLRHLADKTRQHLRARDSFLFIL